MRHGHFLSYTTISTEGICPCKNKHVKDGYLQQEQQMLYGLNLFSAPASVFSGVSPIQAGDICQGDFLCYLLFATIYYLPYFLVLTTIAFVVLIVFRPKTSFGNKLIYSILLSFALIFVFHNFLSIRIQKQGLINSYRQELNQQGHKLYEPTYSRLL